MKRRRSPGLHSPLTFLFQLISVTTILLLSALAAQAEPIARNRIITLVTPEGFPAQPNDISNPVTMVGSTSTLDDEGIRTDAVFVYRNRFREIIAQGEERYEYRGVNDKGHITGNVTANNVRQAFIKTGDAITVITHPFLSALLSPQDINNNGDVVGSFHDSKPHGFVRYANGAFFDLIEGFEESDEIDYFTPAAINDNTVIVGSYSDYNMGTQGFIYDHQRGSEEGSLRVVYHPESRNMRFAGINNWGLIVGNTYVDETTSSAFAYVNKTFIPIEVGEHATEVTGINNWGVITGIYRDSQWSEPQGFVAHALQFISWDQLIELASAQQ